VNSKRMTLIGCACLAAALLWPADASAQRRGGYRSRPGTRTSVVVGVGFGYYRPYFYRPFYYAPYFYDPFWGPYFFDGFYGGWYPAYAYPRPYGYYGYGGYWSSARLEIKPKDAQVYLDGYYVGIVDQFDGVFQRLDIPVGEHELAVYMPGFHTLRQRTLFRPGQTYHFKAVLEPLPPGAPAEPQPQPVPRQNTGPDQYRDPYSRGPYGQPGPYRQPPPPPEEGPEGRRTMPPPERRGDRGGENRPSNFGTLAIRVQPADAVVVIDGERWDSPEGGSRLMVQLAAGQHRVEVRKDGFKTYTSTVDIRPGDTENVNVVLPRQD
jgi:PEGA domain-containing protein